MTQEHLTKTKLDGFRENKLEPSNLLEVTEHLADCAECRNRAVPDSAVSASIAHLQRVFERHLADCELIACADDEPAAESAFVCAHLDYCALCRSELRDLQAFRSRIRASSILHTGPPVWMAMIAAGLWLWP